MNTQRRRAHTEPTRYVPTVPAINLLPETFIDRDWNHTLIKRAVISGLVVVLVGLSIFFFDLYRIGSINRQADDLRQQNVTVLTQLKAHSDIAKLKATTDSLGKAKNAANSRSISWASFLQSLQSTTPTGLTLTQITAATDVTGTSTSSSTQTTLPRGAIGTVQVTAASSTLPDVSSWTSSIGSIPGVHSVNLLSSDRSTGQTDTTQPYSTTLTIVLDSDLYSQTGTEATE